MDAISLKHEENCGRYHDTRLTTQNLNHLEANMEARPERRGARHLSMEA